MDMIIVCGLDGDESVPVIAVMSTRVAPARAVMGTVEVGQRCFVFQNLTYNPNAGIEVSNWDAAMTVVADETANQIAINEQLANPPLSSIILL